jgi:hypothetical protein
MALLDHAYSDDDRVVAPSVPSRKRGGRAAGATNILSTPRFVLPQEPAAPKVLS